MPGLVRIARSENSRATRLTPQYHDRAQPSRRIGLANEQVARDLDENIRNEEDEESNIVVMAFHVEILLESLNARIANVDAVNEGKHVEETNDWHHTKVEFTKKTLLCNWVNWREIDGCFVMYAILRRGLTVGGLGGDERFVGQR